MGYDKGMMLKYSTKALGPALYTIAKVNLKSKQRTTAERHYRYSQRVGFKSISYTITILIVYVKLVFPVTTLVLPLIQLPIHLMHTGLSDALQKTVPGRAQIMQYHLIQQDLAN
jgi:hypothetical protein